jgi:peptide deformylase
MTVPILSYGHKILIWVCREVDPSHAHIETLMANLTDTLDSAEGVGLAAPQINEPIKMFMVDTSKIYAMMNQETREIYFPEGKGLREIFINARMIKHSDETSLDTEGCLSIASIFEEIQRRWWIEVAYQDSHLQQQVAQISGITARVVQHEIHHTQGILFIDHLSSLKKKLIGNKLRQISRGKVMTEYRMKFAG